MKMMLTILLVALLQTSPDQDIRAQLLAWDQAYQVRDVQALGRILADDFTLTDASGAVLTKGEYLMSVVKRPEFNRPAGSLESYDLIVKIDGDKALVTGRSPIKGRPRGKAQTVTGNFFFTDEWVRQQGVWKARHSRIQAAR